MDGIPRSSMQEAKGPPKLFPFWTIQLYSSIRTCKFRQNFFICTSISTFYSMGTFNFSLVPRLLLFCYFHHYNAKKTMGMLLRQKLTAVWILDVNWINIRTSSSKLNLLSDQSFGWLTQEKNKKNWKSWNEETQPQQAEPLTAAAVVVALAAAASQLWGKYCAC